MVSNAIKFTPRHGKVNILLKLIKSTDDLTFGSDEFVDIVKKSAEDTNFLEIQVKDTGVGIKEGDMDQLFKLFGYL